MALASSDLEQRVRAIGLAPTDEALFEATNPLRDAAMEFAELGDELLCRALRELLLLIPARSPAAGCEIAVVAGDLVCAGSHGRILSAVALASELPVSSRLPGLELLRQVLGEPAMCSLVRRSAAGWNQATDGLAVLAALAGFDDDELWQKLEATWKVRSGLPKLVLSLALVVRAARRGDPPVLPEQPAEEDFILDFTAWAIERLLRGDASKEARAELLGALGSSATSLSAVVWCHGSLQELATRVLVAQAIRDRDKAALDEVLMLCNQIGKLKPGLLMLAETLAHRPLRPEPLPASQLIAGERFVVEYLVGVDRVDRVSPMLDTAGLCAVPSALARQLGLAPPGPLDRLHANEPLWLHAWRVLWGGADEAGWFEAVRATIPVAEGIDLVRDLVSGGHRLELRWPFWPSEYEDPGREETGRVRELALRTARELLDESSLRAWKEEQAR